MDNKDYDIFVERMGSFDMIFETPDDISHGNEKNKDEQVSNFIKIMSGDESLLHSGVKGMRWGHRKTVYDASELSDRKKKKASKEYKKLAVKTAQDVVNNRTKLYVNAHNKTADQWNNGKIDAFNKKHNSKAKDYEEKYMAKFEKDLSKNLTKEHLNFLKNNDNYKKSQELVKKYDMTKYDNLVKDNEDFISSMKKQLEE